MFLLNSRNPLVTATYRANFRKRRRHSLYLRYGANLPNSLAKIVPDTPWATHPKHLCWFWVRVRKIHSNRLFKGSRVQLNPPNGRLFLASSGSRLTADYSWLPLVLTITVLPRAIQLNRATTLLSLPRTVTCWTLSHLVYFRSTGILTSSPFDQSC